MDPINEFALVIKNYRLEWLNISIMCILIRYQTKEIISATKCISFFWYITEGSDNLSMTNFGGPCKVRNETETKRNETKQIETKRNKSKRNETDRNETKRNKSKRNETKRNETNRNETKQMIWQAIVGKNRYSLIRENHFLILETNVLI